MEKKNLNLISEEEISNITGGGDCSTETSTDFEEGDHVLVIKSCNMNDEADPVNWYVENRTGTISQICPPGTYKSNNKYVFKIDLDEAYIHSNLSYSFTHARSDKIKKIKN